MLGLSCTSSLCGTVSYPDSVSIHLICFRSFNKTNQRKVPKRIHKAEREKMKREHLNELFLDLANALGNLLCLY